MRNKLSSFYNIIYDSDFSVVIVTETWLCNSFTDGLLDPKCKFSIFKCDTPSPSPAGGVCILVTKKFQCNELTIDNLIFGHLEIVSCTITAKQSNILLVCCYIPPDVSLDLLATYMRGLCSICNNYDLFVVTGDFNAAGIDWSNNYFPNIFKSRLLFDFFTDYGLIQIVDEPTCDDNFLDLIFVNDTFCISDCTVAPPFGSSDHDSIIFSIC